MMLLPQQQSHSVVVIRPLLLPTAKISSEAVVLILASVLVIGGRNMINDVTVNELNKLIGDGIRVRFAPREKPMILVLEFINSYHLRTWCNIMNVKAFPMQRGVMMGEKSDSAVKIYPLIFRFPEEFYHLISYIRNGRIYYDTKTNVWKYRNKEDQGHLETGYGIELFQTWMERQFSRLTKLRIQTLLHRLDLVDDPTDENLACFDTAHYIVQLLMVRLHQLLPISGLQLRQHKKILHIYIYIYI
jgi:hypothetical protein